MTKPNFTKLYSIPVSDGTPFEGDTIVVPEEDSRLVAYAKFLLTNPTKQQVADWVNNQDNDNN